MAPPKGAKKFDVLLAGYFGFGNLGDELLAEAAVNNLMACGVAKEGLAILSRASDESPSRLGVESFDRWSFQSVSNAIKRSRALFLPGGGLFQDATSALSCVYYWGIVALAVALSVPVVALGQSVGPLSGNISRFLTRRALLSCSYIAVRDDASRHVLNDMDVPCAMMPDPVMSLKAPERSGGGDEVLINVRPVRGNRHSVSSVAAASRSCEASGIPMIGVAMSDEDGRFMKELQASGDMPRFEIKAPRSAGEFFVAASRARASVGMRLHFAILSILSGLEVVMSPYDPKVSSFADAWGLKLLKLEESDENFDIMKLLTNSWFRDKRKIDEVRLLVADQFRIALDRTLGD
ncbi:MAG: polysaccharide pyruvyl transferase family protein [Synergistaceae bacterium]|jgi:polysaccharide pyruvyl transferase CsaB|nr:polysaccharide pyruvyl transferase family protein [Synergistaceae bacterium]